MRKDFSLRIISIAGYLGIEDAMEDRLGAPKNRGASEAP
jgi:hypothetical protein